jgi:hypothetical protein
MQTDGQGVGLKPEETEPCRPVPLQCGDFFFRLRVFQQIKRPAACSAAQWTNAW